MCSIETSGIEIPFFCHLIVWYELSCLQTHWVQESELDIDSYNDRRHMIFTSLRSMTRSNFSWSLNFPCQTHLLSKTFMLFPRPLESICTDHFAHQFRMSSSNGPYGMRILLLHKFIGVNEKTFGVYFYSCLPWLDGSGVSNSVLCFANKKLISNLSQFIN